MYTIFINDVPLKIVDAYEAEEWKGNASEMFVAEKEMQLLEVLEEMEHTPNHPGCIYLSANPDVTWQVFVSYCTLIEASGGLVKNESGEYLIIFRKGKYDLPKGKLDYDESPEEGALREVEEECGVSGLKIIHPLEKSYHTYHEKGKRFLKKTNWYLMNAHSQPLVPQLDEQITKAEWMSENTVKEVALKNTYASVAAILKKNLSAKA